MSYISVVSGGAKLLAAALLFIMVRHPSDYLLAIAAQSGGLLLAGVAGFWVALRVSKSPFAGLLAKTCSKCSARAGIFLYRAPPACFTPPTTYSSWA